MREGVDWIEALCGTADPSRRCRRAGVGRSVGNLAWALAELAETAERRLATAFRWRFRRSFPLVVVMLGMVVFILAMAYFLPLVNLIKKLA